jgi:hypothetical protein
LAKFKTKVMADLAHARAESQGFLKSTTGITAWLRNTFMSFAMHVCAWFNSEKLFEQNEATTSSMKRTLRNIQISSSEEVSESSLEMAQTSTTNEPSNENDDFEVVAPTSFIATLKIDQEIVEHLKVIDTPRDGSCMLWSVLAGLPPSTEATPTDVSHQMAITGDQGKISDDKVLLARDVTIPELRQVISMGMMAEGKDVPQAREIEAGGFGAKHIEPEQMKYIAKHLQTDIAIITKQGNQSIAYLCTKEGTVMTSQNGSESFLQDRFQTALRTGPAIFAQDNHARCLKYNADAQVDEP